MTPPLCDWLGLNIAITTSSELEVKSNPKSFIRRQCFSCGELPLFCAVNLMYSLNDFIGGYVCCCLMCLHAGECFLFKHWGL